MSDEQKNRGRSRLAGTRGAKAHHDASRDRQRERPFGKDDGEGDASGRPTERIAKRLARAGISSRREAEALVEAGRVTVNGKVLSSPAVNVGPDDQIAIDGTQIPAIERTRLFLFHKPAGVVTTNRDPQGRQTVFDVLPEGLPRLMTIGRLDINTEGLLLLTNDGGLARALELPSTGWLRRYRVRVHGEVDEQALAALKDGIAVDGVFYGAVEASLDRKHGTNAWLTIGLREGKNREVKNILGTLGLDVNRLIRVSYGPFQLGELPEREVHELKGRTLRDQLGERLIEEAGANFDAPVTTPFSRKRPESRPEKEAQSHGPRPTRTLRVEEGGLIRNRKRERERRREDALDRLTTKGARPAKDGKRGDPPPQRRSANVWMAPGARPGGGRPKDEDKPGETNRGKHGKPARGAFSGTKKRRPEGERAGSAKGDASGLFKERRTPSSPVWHDESDSRRERPQSGAKPERIGRNRSPEGKKPWREGAPKNGRPQKSPEDKSGSAKPRRNDTNRGKPGADRRR